MDKEANKELVELKKSLMKLKVDSGMGQLTDYSKIKKTKKEIARFLTRKSLEKKDVKSK